MNQLDQPGFAVTHEETPTDGAFRILEFAELLYRRPEPHLLDANHTLVSRSLRGRGLAHDLYHAMVEFARRNQRQVIPTCPFIEAMFEQYPEDRDVLSKGDGQGGRAKPDGAS